MMIKTDVTIIGAGPVGLFAVFQCGMLGLSCAVVDALPEIGGQCTALYPEKPIYDIPGFPKINAGDLIANLEAQAAPFHPKYILNASVTELSKVEDRFALITASGESIDCGSVIVAAGAGAFGPNRPPIDGLDAFEGKSVFYMVRNRDDFAGKRVVIAGGGDSAVDWALSLNEIAAKVFVVHRRDQFRAAPDSVARLKKLADENDNVELVIPYQLKDLQGKNGQIIAVDVASLDGDIRVLEADCLLAFYGLAAKLGPIAEWGLGVSANHVSVEPTTCATNVPGVFAIGDVVTYDHKLKLILTGFSEGATAAHAAFCHMNPGKEIHMEYSTAKGVPGEKGSDIKTIAA